MNKRLRLIYPLWKEAGQDFVASAERYVVGVIGFYDSRARWTRRFYRSTGVVTILTGASLPLLTTLSFTGKSVAVSAAGCLVALTTALRAFYRWDHSWTMQRQTEMEITHEYLAWKAECATVEDPAVRAEKTSALLERVFTLRQIESAEYFRSLSEPTVPAQARNVSRS